MRTCRRRVASPVTATTNFLAVDILNKRGPPIRFSEGQDPNSYRGMQAIAAHVHPRHRPQRGEQPMPFDHHRPSLVASVLQTRSGAITSGGAAVNIRLTDWDDHRSRPRQQRDIAMRAVTVPPRPR